MSKRNVTFEKFKQSCDQHGANMARVRNDRGVFVMFTKNNIKTELKNNWYTVGFQRTQEELDLLEAELTSKGFTIISRLKSVLNVDFKTDQLAGFWDIVNLEENIDTIVGKSRGVARRVFSPEVAESNLFEKIAKRYRYAIETQDQDLLDLARDLISADKRDNLITIGYSKDHSEKSSYREHIVPCIMIHNQAIEMTLAGSSIVEVAQMIKSNLAIVMISNQEQHLLDVTLGWRTTMPEGWQFGNDPLARLKQAGIELK